MMNSYSAPKGLARAAAPLLAWFAATLRPDAENPTKLADMYAEFASGLLIFVLGADEAESRALNYAADMGDSNTAYCEFLEELADEFAGEPSDLEEAADDFLGEEAEEYDPEGFNDDRYPSTPQEERAAPVGNGAGFAEFAHGLRGFAEELQDFVAEIESPLPAKGASRGALGDDEQDERSRLHEDYGYTYSWRPAKGYRLYKGFSLHDDEYDPI